MSVLQRTILDAGLLKRFTGIVSVAACLAAMAIAGCGGSAGAPTVGTGQRNSPPPPTPTPSPIPTGKIDHVIIIFQENRSTDNMFNGFPGADTVTTGSSGGRTVVLHPWSLAAPGDLDHSHGGFLIDLDGGLMDGWNGEQQFNFGNTPDPMYAYVPATETKPYWDLAEQFTFADRMFQSNEGPSYPAHQFIISGTSAPSVGSDLLASENPADATHTKPQGGCDSPADMLVHMIDPSGSEHQQLYPCFEHQTLPDLLDAQHITWTYYEPKRGGFWDGPTSIRHIRDTPDDWKRVVTPETTVLDDIAAGKLPQVTWVIPDGSNSDHAGDGTSTGPAWVASITNAIGASNYWKTTAIFITWDDWGGWYDHVAPVRYGSYELGFRVPLIVVSPYAKAGYVSHTQHEFGSILHFIENAYGLGSLGYTDARADDLSDCFNFAQTPLPYHQVMTPYSRKQVLHAAAKFVEPDND